MATIRYISLTRFLPEQVIHSNCEVLVGSKIPLGRLDRSMPKSDCICSISVGFAAEVGAGAAQVMGRELTVLIFAEQESNDAGHPDDASVSVDGEPVPF